MFFLTYFPMRDLGVGLKDENMMRKKWWGKDSFDEKNDDKKLDKGDCPTLRIIYI